MIYVICYKIYILIYEKFTYFSILFFKYKSRFLINTRLLCYSTDGKSYKITQICDVMQVSLIITTVLYCRPQTALTAASSLSFEEIHGSSRHDSLVPHEATAEDITGRDSTVTLLSAHTCNSDIKTQQVLVRPHL